MRISAHDKIRGFCAKNNIPIGRLAADLQVTVACVYYWMKHKAPTDLSERLEALETAKRASGDYPAPGLPPDEARKAKMREIVKIAIAARSEDWHAKALEARKKRYNRRKKAACRRHYDEIAAAELASCHHRIAFSTLYNQTINRRDGKPGYMYEGRKQVYYFD